MVSPQSSLHKIDKRISNYQETFTSLPRSSHRRSDLLVKLASLQLKRFKLSDDERDLEASMLQYTHAIFLPFHHLTELRRDATLTAIFIRLSQILIHRSRTSNQAGDVRYSAKYLRYLRDHPPRVEVFDTIPFTHNEVTALLTDALALQFELEHDNAALVLIIEEMSVRCRELLSSDAVVQGLNAAVETFARTILAHIKDTPDQPWQQVIECLSEANTRLPYSHSVSMALSRVSSLRFQVTKSNDDYECAMGHLDKFIASHFLEGGPSETLRQYFDQAARIAALRYSCYGNLEYLEEAISRTRAYVDFVSHEDPERGTFIWLLGELVKRRAWEFGDTDIPLDDHSLALDDLPSFSQLAATLAGSDTAKPPSMTTEACALHLRAIESAGRITDKAEIHEVIRYCRLLRLSLQRSSNRLTDLTLLHVGHLFSHAFELTSEPEYLNESIDIYRRILELRRVQWMHPKAILRLLVSLSIRLDLFKGRNDLDQMLQLFPIISDSPYAKAHERFLTIAYLARYSRAFKHPLTSALYHDAISLLSDTLVFAPTLEIQHSRLTQFNDMYEWLPLDYASYQVQRGQHKGAIETLEQGRGLVWSQMRGFRTPINRLRVFNPHLAEEFASVSRELEVLTTSASPSVLMNAVEADEDEEMGSFDRILAKHRKLLDERNRLIAQIRALPGFEDLLMASSFDTLQSAAAGGPVIIVNHSRFRSDIIILLYNSPPSLIPTTGNFYNCARGLGEQLSAARGIGLGSMEYQETLVHVLKALYDLVGLPVIQRLQELNVPEQSRVWWLPTSVFCSLPLHAMGPIRSDGPHKLYFSDLYIPSYTPTLSALINSRKPGMHSSEKPSILLVGQPDESVPKVYDEISLIRRLKTTVKTLISTKATPSAVIQCLQDHRFAHFSCHGILETARPFDASFKLYQGKRLTLLEIIRSQLPSAEFAFLSACHTAELTENSVTGEGLHLTAAVQFAGFRSVVGTMWAMADIDGPDLAKHFYASVFSERWEGVPHYERTAEALRDAVRELRRKKRMTMERWVNFVHYGA